MRVRYTSGDDCVVVNKYTSVTEGARLGRSNLIARWRVE